MGVSTPRAKAAVSQRRPLSLPFSVEDTLQSNENARMASAVSEKVSANIGSGPLGDAPLSRFLRVEDPELAAVGDALWDLKQSLALQCVYLTGCCHRARSLAVRGGTHDSKSSAIEKALVAGGVSSITVGIIGGGVIGGVVAHALLDAGIPPPAVLMSTRSPLRQKDLVGAKPIAKIRSLFHSPHALSAGADDTLPLLIEAQRALRQDAIDGDEPIEQYGLSAGGCRTSRCSSCRPPASRPMRKRSHAPSTPCAPSASSSSNSARSSCAEKITVTNRPLHVGQHDAP